MVLSKDSFTITRLIIDSYTKSNYLALIFINNSFCIIRDREGNFHIPPYLSMGDIFGYEEQKIALDNNEWHDTHVLKTQGLKDTTVLELLNTFDSEFLGNQLFIHYILNASTFANAIRLERLIEKYINSGQHESCTLEIKVSLDPISVQQTKEILERLIEKYINSGQHESCTLEITDFFNQL